MSKNNVITKFEKLPPEAQKQAGDFVEFLYERYVRVSSKQTNEKPISESPFIGMWKDREDMADSTEWVRKQRKEQWTRRRNSDG